MRGLVDDLRDAIARDPDPWDETLYERAASELERLQAFAVSVADIVAMEHQPDLGHVEVAGEWREMVVCQHCSRSGGTVQWPCATLLVVDPDTTAVTEADLITMRHMRHARMCNCLGESAVCCNPRCGCHEGKR
jgi:hypothetical protein